MGHPSAMPRTESRLAHTRLKKPAQPPPADRSEPFYVQFHTAQRTDLLPAARSAAAHFREQAPLNQRVSYVAGRHKDSFGQILIVLQEKYSYEQKSSIMPHNCASYQKNAI
jgi:hypothetical protein